MNILKFSLIAILLVCSSNALFTGTISSIISTGVNAINGAIVGGQFVWDNAINPALQVLQQNSIDFIDNHFGNLLAGIGKRTLTTKVQVKNEFLAETNEYFASLKKLFLGYVAQVKFQLSILYPTFVDGQANTNEAIAQLTQATLVQIEQLTETTIQNFKSQFDESVAAVFEKTIKEAKEKVVSVINFVSQNMSI